MVSHHMQPLEYGAQPRTTSAATASLFLLPIAVTFVTYVSLGSFLGEPFHALSVRDALIFAASPAVAASLTAAWLIIAHSRRARWFLVIPVAVWLLLNVCVTIDTLLRYLREPWNQ
jgi:membrane associated rhomboid family serine protease